MSPPISRSVGRSLSQAAGNRIGALQLIAPAQFLSNAMVLNGAGVRLHADPLTLVNVCVSRNLSTGDSTCKVSLSGYFVDLP